MHRQWMRNMRAPVASAEPRPTPRDHIWRCPRNGRIPDAVRASARNRTRSWEKP